MVGVSWQKKKKSFFYFFSQSTPTGLKFGVLALFLTYWAIMFIPQWMQGFGWAFFYIFTIDAH